MIWSHTKNKKDWSKWFAWHPVRMTFSSNDDWPIVWLQYVNRRKNSYTKEWDYILPTNNKDL